MSGDCQPAEQVLPEPASSTSVVSRVKILLHATDGAFPYLTPQLLRQWFAPNDVPMLQLGLAAQDSCIAPSFVRKDGTVGQKPSGFKVAAFALDEWLQDYPRVAVPTFDPLTILAGSSSSTKNQQRANQQRPVSTAAAAPTTSTATTRNGPKPPSINLQTLNGRVQVTHDDYGQMASSRSLSTSSSSSFAAILPLFEHPPNETKRRPLRHVMERNFEWTIKALKDASIPASTVVWLPVSIPRKDDDNNDDDDAHRADLQEFVNGVCQWMANLDETLLGRLSHVCFVDWHLVHDDVTRRHILDAFAAALPAAVGLALLAVHSTEQLSLALQFARTTSRPVSIGTSLPTHLAQQCQALTMSRKAMGQAEKKPKLDSCNDPEEAVAVICNTVSLKVTDPVPSHPWFQDACPIDDACTCLTCRDHSRSYLYHLASSNELLVEILLFVHNLHQILQASQEESTL